MADRFRLAHYAGGSTIGGGATIQGATALPDPPVTVTPASITLSDGTTTHNLLLAGSRRIRYGMFDTGAPVHNISWSGSRRRDGRLPAFSHRGNREIAATVIIAGEDVDTVLDRVSAVNLMLTRATLYYESGGEEGAPVVLTLQLADASHVTEFEVLAGQCLPGNWATIHITRTSAPQLIDAEIRLICSPFGQAADQSLVVAAANYAVVPVQALGLPGEIETPATFAINVNQAVSNPLIWIGRKSGDHALEFLHMLRGEEGTYIGHSVADIAAPASVITYSQQAAVGTASNDAFGRWTGGPGASGNNRLARWTIASDFHAAHTGQFRVRVRVKCEGSEDRSLLLYYGTQTTPTKTAQARITVALTTSWSYVDLGVVQFPDVSLAHGLTFETFVLELEAGNINNTDTLDIDHLLLIPIEEGYIEFLLSAALVSGDSVVVTEQTTPPSIYVTNAAGQVKTSVVPETVTGGYPRLVPGDQVFSIGVVNELADVLADTYNAVIVAKPRYHWLRGGTG